MERFSKHHIGSILDLAMEADVSSNRPTLPEAKQTAERIEKLMKECIDLASHQENSFIAVKITAFVPPDLLLRWTGTLKALKKAFDTHANPNGLVGEKEFALLMSDAFGTPSEKAIALFKSFQTEHIDWILVSNSLSVLNKEFREFLVQYAKPNDITGEDVLLNIADFDMVDAVYSHLEQLCEYGKDKNVRILMDAEQTYFQAAIDDIVLNLCRTVNAKERTNAPTVFNTYQMYLKDALGRLEKDVLRSERYGYHFGIKIVRGAYMTSERERASEMEYPDPIQPSIEHTHNAYNAGVAFFIKKIGENTNSSIIPLSLLVASHNDISVRKATELMKVHNVSPSNRTVAFAQLMGMKDGISFSLANQGYAIYKVL
jgi:proline dehydrogenase